MACRYEFPKQKTIMEDNIFTYGTFWKKTLNMLFPY